ncbi:phosphoribosyl transferase [Tupanvirus soda lake]|uniref:Phosphoribosyl transferase n=2 Tax=Tupanvirus TaxID=2094720 RepID=A0A6N1NXK8_9VIRU|nr:phosphoribosyl transferase [Tupanvirus soda lake]QKU35938.1 phosphoribosyl transferase [Tupanvirus soda lake]
MSVISILLASESFIKKEAVETFFKINYPNIKYDLTSINCDACGLPPQPIDCGKFCCYERTKFALEHSYQSYDITISIENDLVYFMGHYIDSAHARITCNGIVGTGSSNFIDCPITQKQMEKYPQHIYSDKIRGYSCTAGQILNETLGWDPKNWMLESEGIDRKTQITEALNDAFNNLFDNVSNCYSVFQDYKSYSDFPKKGVTFKYFYSLFVSKNMKKIAKLLSTKYEAHNIDAIFPLETRGLVLGTLLADHLETTMIPLQKPGKIPGKSLPMPYQKEYGSDEIQISVDIMEVFLDRNKKSFYRFLIVDDLIATGGTIKAGLFLLEKLSKQYGFKYDVEVLSLEEVLPLRTDATEKIGQDYYVLFRNINNALSIVEQLKN